MAAPATQPKSRGRRLTRDPPTKIGFVRAALQEGLAEGWVPTPRHQSQAHGTSKRTLGSNAPSRSASTTASDASEPKRARWDNQTDVGLAEQAGSATGSPLNKQASGSNGEEAKTTTNARNRLQGSARCRATSGGSDKSGPTDRDVSPTVLQGRLNG